MNNRLRALSGTVIVALGDFERTDAGIQIVPGSVLAYGREVFPPWGVVIATGDDDFEVGQRVIVQNSEAAPRWQGMRIVCLHTRRLVTEDLTPALRRARAYAGRRSQAPEEVAARMLAEDEYSAPGTRVILELEAPEPESGVVHVIARDRGPVDVGVVHDVGPRVTGEVYAGDRVLVRHDAGFRWQLGGRSWASVREADLLALDGTALGGEVEDWAVVPSEDDTSHEA